VLRSFSFSCSFYPGFEGEKSTTKRRKMGATQKRDGASTIEARPLKETGNEPNGSPGERS
jgi:hypothetical protein